jgi:hypothetical protein
LRLAQCSDDDTLKGLEPGGSRQGARQGVEWLVSWAGGLAAAVQFGWSGGWGRELQGPGARGYLVGVVLWSLRVGGKTGLVGFAAEVVVYHHEHVVIGTVNHCYACVEIAEVHGAAMALRVTGKEHQRGSRKGEDFGPWFAEPSNNKLYVYLPLAARAHNAKRI